MKRRILAIFVIIGILATLVAACTPKGTEVTTTSESVTKTSAAAAESTAATTKAEAAESEADDKDPFGRFADPVVIHAAKNDGFAFHGQHEGFKAPDDNKWLDDIAEKLNVTFEFDWITTDGESDTTKWNAAIASGNLPEMGSINRVQYESLLEAGKIADMTDIYEELASPLFKEVTAPSNELAYQTRDDRLYGLPYANAYPQNFDLLVVRQDWLDRVGMDAPTSIDEMIAVARAFKEAQLGGEDTYGLALNPASAWASIKGFFQGYGIPYRVWALDDDNKAYYGGVDERMKDALLQLQQMYQEGLLRQDYVMANAAESITAGEAGMLYSVSWGPVNAVDLYQTDLECDMIFCEIPTLEGSLPTYYDSAIPGAFLYVNADSENQEAIMKVMNVIAENLYDPSYDWGYARGATPVGNVNYEPYFSVALYAREIEYAYNTGDTSKFTSASAQIYYERLIDFENGDRVLGRYHPIYRTEVGSYALINDALQSDRIRNTVYMAPDTETMQERMGALDELLLNAINNVIMGEDISVWEAAVDEWFATGGQTMTDEVNDWLSAQ